VLTGTLGKALGGASGGYTSGRKEIVALLRQRSRPYTTEPYHYGTGAAGCRWSWPRYKKLKRRCRITQG
jgi:7-keto-8-aminopelargonate synthetase-like enzyme